MISDEDTSAWHQTASYERTRQFVMPGNTKNNIVILRPIANDTSAAMLRFFFSRAQPNSMSKIHGITYSGSEFRFEEDKC